MKQFKKGVYNMQDYEKVLTWILLIILFIIAAFLIYLNLEFVKKHSNVIKIGFIIVLSVALLAILILLSYSDKNTSNTNKATSTVSIDIQKSDDISRITGNVNLKSVKISTLQNVKLDKNTFGGCPNLVLLDFTNYSEQTIKQQISLMADLINLKIENKDCNIVFSDNGNQFVYYNFCQWRKGK